METNDIGGEYDQLFAKVAKSNFSLNYLSQSQAFLRRCDNEEKLRPFTIDCERMISSIYYFNDMLEESLAIDLKHLSNQPTTA